jgi:hypothetical protein
MVGAERFELPTLCSQSRCATRLRYAPTCSVYRSFRGPALPAGRMQAVQQAASHPQQQQERQHGQQHQAGA